MRRQSYLLMFLRIAFIPVLLVTAWPSEAALQRITHRATLNVNVPLSTVTVGQVSESESVFLPKLPGAASPLNGTATFSLTGTAVHTFSNAGDLPAGIVSLISVREICCVAIFFQDWTNRFPASGGQIYEDQYAVFDEATLGGQPDFPSDWLGIGFKELEFEYAIQLTGASQATQAGQLTGIVSASYTIDAAQADTLTQESIDEILARDDVSVELIDNPPSTIREWLKAQLMYLSGTGFISDVEPKDIEDQSGYEDFAGIRAPADQIAHDDQLNSPTPEYGNAAVHVKTGSPMSFSAIVDVLAGEAMLAFDFTFLHPGTALSVTLGGNNILTLLANDYPIGTRQSVDMAIDWDTITSELIFTLDGPTANLGALIYDLRYPGADLRSIGNWFANGGGTAQYVYATSDVQMDALRIAGSDPDGDGLATYYDNCPNVQNTANFPDSEGWAQQQDDDGDNIGNACDLVVTTPWLPSGRAGKIYNRQLTATRGIPPYTWTITSGNPPLGVTLNSAGLLYGNVQSTFLTFFTVKVTDATGDSAFKDLSIRIIIPACVSCHATPEL